jgi:D-alanine-D-alanine ligase
MTLVAIAHESPRASAGRRTGGDPSEFTERSCAAIERACERVGWPSKRLAVGGSLGTGLSWTRALVEDLDRIQPDVIFNLVDGLGGDARLQAAVAWIFEMSGIPCTGSDPGALSLALDKPVAKALLLARGIPVARGRLAERGDELFPDLLAPLIVKPSREAASRGISLESVVDDEASALRQVLRVTREFRQPALVEEFASGPEFQAIILGTGEAAELLPLSLIDYSAFPAGRRPLLTFAARWDESSAESVGAACVAAPAMAPGLHADLAAAALGAHRVLGFRDYARIDLRIHPERGPVVLDADPRPDLAPLSSVARAAARASLSHGDLVEQIVLGALRRGRGSA